MSNEVNDQSRAHGYKYQGFPTIIAFSNTRQGHLKAVLRIMGYLKLRHYSRLVFDPSYPDIDHSNFWESDWTNFYDGAMEAIPPNIPPPKGKEVDLCVFIESEYSCNK